MGGKNRETSTHHRFQSSAYVHKPLDSEDLKSNGPETYLSHSSLCRTSIILDSSPPRHPSEGRSLSNSRVKSSCLDLTLPTPSRRRDLSPSARPSMRTLMCSIIDSIHAPSHASPCVRQRPVGLMISSTFLHGRRSGFLASSGGDTHRRAAPHNKVVLVLVETLTGVRPPMKSRTACSTAATRSSRGDGAMVTSPTAESSLPWPSSSGPPSLAGGRPNERRADRKRRCSSSWGGPRSERCCRAMSTCRFRVLGSEISLGAKCLGLMPCWSGQRLPM